MRLMKRWMKRWMSRMQPVEMLQRGMSTVHPDVNQPSGGEKLTKKKKQPLKELYREMTNTFLNSFTVVSNTSLMPSRTIGREAEYPIVSLDGMAGNAVALLEQIAADNPEMFKKVDEIDSMSAKSSLLSLHSEKIDITLEVGKGTIEVISQPCKSLKDLQVIHEDAMERVAKAAEKLGMLVLGYGIQPFTKPSHDLVTPRTRYSLLIDAVGPSWLWFAVTASDQIHVDVHQAEVISVTNLCNVLSPMVVALCGNSSIVGGLPNSISSRESLMGEIKKTSWRHGMPKGPFRNANDFIRKQCKFDLLIRQDQEGRWQRVPSHTSFHQYMQVEGLDWNTFLTHDHYIWNSVRPRVKQVGTVEFRAACQQPWKSHMAANALQLGIVEAKEELSTYLSSLFHGNDRLMWQCMHEWHKNAVETGLKDAHTLKLCQAYSDVTAFEALTNFLNIISEGLERRGLHEEVYLEPLYERLAKLQNPGQWSIQQLDGLSMKDFIHSISMHGEQK